MNYVWVWVIHQARPAPLHEVISALTHSVCQGHTLPLLFWCWFWRIPALAWVTGSVKQMFSKLLSGNVNRISPHLSLLVARCCSLKLVLRCHRSTGMVGLYRYSFHYQPATFSTLYFEFLDYTYHKKPNKHTPPGFLGLQSTCSPHLLGHWVILLHSVLSLYRAGGWMNETRAWSPHSSCWDCSCNFRAFRVSVNLLRNPETQSLKLDVYSAERLMPKSLYVLFLKRVRYLQNLCTLLGLCSQLFFSHLFVSCVLSASLCLSSAQTRNSQRAL